MTGTSRAVTRPMLRTPPMMTAAVRPMSTMPVMPGAMEKLWLRASATELDCTMLPMPKVAMAANKAKSVASHFQPSPREM